MENRQTLKKFPDWKKENDEIVLEDYRGLPGRLNVGQAAKLLGFQEHDIRILIESELLMPLGEPVPNARKYFAKAYILNLTEDVEWLHKATHAVSANWQKKNSGRKTASADETALAV